MCEVQSRSRAAGQRFGFFAGVFGSSDRTNSRTISVFVLPVAAKCLTETAMRTAAALMIAMIGLTTAAVAGPPPAVASRVRSATKAPSQTHHAHRQAPFPMAACVKSAERIYNPSEAQAVCLDLRAGV